MENFLHVHPTPEWLQRYKMASHMACEGDFWMTAMSPSPQLYLSKDSVLHLRISAYVALERSGTAFRLINYRNNSALALSENGEYGFAYHYNCRGLINMHHEKLSITFDKDRQILLRTEKPSFVKKENEYYRLTSHHWTQCRPVLMDFFDRDKTPEILKKSGPDKANDEAKLTDLINSSVMQKDAGVLTRDARIETRLNGDVTLSWMYGETINSLMVSPLTGGVSLSARNLEIIATAKNDIYIAFADFFVHTRSQQMTVSSGAISSRGAYSKSHPCLLKLTSTTPENQMSDIRQFCSYMYNEHHSHQGANAAAAMSGGVHRHGGHHEAGTAQSGQSQGETPTPSAGRPLEDQRRSRHSSEDVVTLSESPAKENSSAEMRK
nr:unnamed protein product [Spirometra erinaceieuropaei]